MLLLDGKSLSEKRLDALKQRILSTTAPLPKLCVIRVGNDPASEVYVRKKIESAGRVGIVSAEIHLSENSSQEALLNHIHSLNHDDSVDGILVQLPLPKQIDTQQIIESIDPAKDVDGFHPFNLGRLATGEKSLVACTPLGILNLLKEYQVPIKGREAVVIGRSRTVGRPMSFLLDQAGATVTVIHRDTIDPSTISRRADLLIVAAGKPGLIGASDVKSGACVVDVGIHRNSNGKLSGDVRFSEVQSIVAAITPVPGGVGPMTVCTLLENTFLAYQLRKKIS